MLLFWTLLHLTSPHQGPLTRPQWTLKAMPFHCHLCDMWLAKSEENTQTKILMSWFFALYLHRVLPLEQVVHYGYPSLYSQVRLHSIPPLRYQMNCLRHSVHADYYLRFVRLMMSLAQSELNIYCFPKGNRNRIMRNIKSTAFCKKSNTILGIYYSNMD